MKAKEIRELFEKMELLEGNNNSLGLRLGNRWNVPDEEPVYWLIADGSSTSDTIDRLNKELSGARLERLTS